MFDMVRQFQFTWERQRYGTARRPHCLLLPPCLPLPPYPHLCPSLCCQLCLNPSFPTRLCSLAPATTVLGLGITNSFHRLVLSLLPHSDEVDGGAAAVAAVKSSIEDSQLNAEA